jgi:hypothetical protein
VPRSLHGEWEAPTGRDPLSTLAAQDRDRRAELVPVRCGRMLSSAFASPGARSGDRVAIAERDADQNERDYAALPVAEERGRIEVARGL